MKPIKLIRDSRVAYLNGLASVYEDLGYGVKVERHNKCLEVYAKGTVIPKTVEEAVIDKWIN